MSEHLPPAVSVLTLAGGRPGHLVNMVRGLSRQTHPPCELVVGVLQDDLFTLPDAPFAIRQIVIPDRAAGLPLARARNAVAAAAQGEVLVFLDVDCIPEPALVADYARHALPGAGLMMGEVGYLPDGATRGDWDIADFARISVRHSDRQGPPAEGVEPCTDYRCFWSLTFAMHRDDFAASGGFDERYVGYGGEDTDFGRTLSHRGIAISWIRGARSYHQYHPHHMPPVHHLRSVVRNAELFASKWGHRTMEHWLYAFQLMGLIRDTPQGMEILREPGEAELAVSRQEAHMPYANTRRVIDVLQARIRVLPGGAERRAEVDAAQKALLLRPTG